MYKEELSLENMMIFKEISSYFKYQYGCLLNEHGRITLHGSSISDIEVDNKNLFTVSKWVFRKSTSVPVATLVSIIDN